MRAFNIKNAKSLLITVAAILLLNIISNFFFQRFDLTQDHRYTLSPTTLKIIKEVKAPLSIKVYLQGELPAEFKRLQLESKQLLEEFQAYNSNIILMVSVLSSSECIFAKKSLPKKKQIKIKSIHNLFLSFFGFIN